MWQASDAAVEGFVLGNLARTPIGELSPMGCVVHRWPAMLPQFGAGYLRPGIFSAGLSTKGSTMAEAAEEMKKEIRRLVDDPPSAEEMDYAKESILNSFIFNYTSRGQILGQQMTYTWFGMPSDYLETYRANIEKVTGDDVTRVAKKYVHPDRMILLVVGKAEDFVKHLIFYLFRNLDVGEHYGPGPRCHNDGVCVVGSGGGFEYEFPVMPGQ